MEGDYTAIVDLNDCVENNLPENGWDGNVNSTAEQDSPDENIELFTNCQQFARVVLDTDASAIFNHLTNVWKLDQPSLLISITGVAKNFTLNAELYSQFISDLAKVAKTPGAWFITDGANTGVMMHVGEAILGATKACISISTGRKSTCICHIVTDTGAFLDHNHTHHLFADDGFVGNNIIEIPLRSRIEKRIIKEARGAAILMVVGGGLETLDTVHNALGLGSLDVPKPNCDPPLSVLVIKGSGGVADLLAYAFDNRDGDDDYLSAKAVELLPELNSEEQIKACRNGVLNCIKKNYYIEIFEMSNKGGLDETIRKEILKGCEKLELLKQLELTLLWDRADLAKYCISLRGYLGGDLDSAMIMALALDRVDFVKLFNRYGIDMKFLLTTQVLELLYGYCYKGAHTMLKYLIKTEDLLPFYSSKVGLELDSRKKKCVEIFKFLYFFEKYELEIISISLNTIKSVVNDAFSDIMRSKADKFLEGNTNQSKFKDPYNELFFFGLLCNMPNITRYLWSLQERCLNKAFLGIVINNYLAETARKNNPHDDFTNQVERNQINFRELCTNLLDQCFREDSEKTKQLIASSSSKLNYHNCLHLAVITDHKEFISHNAVQTNMIEVWNGFIRDPNISCTELAIAFIIPPFIFRNGFLKDSQTSLVEKMGNFYRRTPVVKFMTHLFSYLIFLAFFAYVLMVKKDTTTQSITEWILVSYIVTLTIEEMLQVKQDKALTFNKKISNWWSSNWNKLDGAAQLVFYIGLVLRFNQRTLDLANVFHALNFGMWVIRSLNTFYVDQTLVSYVVMIFRMFLDLVSFLPILFVFLVAYGISAISILKPQEGGPNVVVDAIFHPYFNLFGELFIDRDPLNDNTTRFGTPEKNSYSELLAWILLGSYLLIAYVLFNLLVAILNNTYQRLQSSSVQIWKLERYKLIMEYANRPPLIPLLYYIYKLIDYLNDYYHNRSQPPKMPLDDQTLTKEQLNDLIQFEKRCMRLLLRKKKGNKTN